jgi:hypothetical protein
LHEVRERIRLPLFDAAGGANRRSGARTWALQHEAPPRAGFFVLPE